MIYGIGVDITSKKRILAVLNKFGDRFVNKILNAEEIGSFVNPKSMIAKSFASKEAFSKAFGTGIGGIVKLHSISIIRMQSGKPYIKYYGELDKFMRENLLTSYLSISDNGDTVVSVVVISKLYTDIAYSN